MIKTSGKLVYQLIVNDKEATIGVEYDNVNQISLIKKWTLKIDSSNFQEKIKNLNNKATWEKVMDTLRDMFKDQCESHFSENEKSDVQHIKCTESLLKNIIGMFELEIPLDESIISPRKESPRLNLTSPRNIGIDPTNQPLLLLIKTMVEDNKLLKAEMSKINRHRNEQNKLIEQLHSKNQSLIQAVVSLDKKIKEEREEREKKMGDMEQFFLKKIRALEEVGINDLKSIGEMTDQENYNQTNTHHKILEMFVNERIETLKKERESEKEERMRTNSTLELEEKELKEKQKIYELIKIEDNDSNFVITSNLNNRFTVTKLTVKEKNGSHKDNFTNFCTTVISKTWLSEVCCKISPLNITNNVFIGFHQKKDFASHGKIIEKERKGKYISLWSGKLWGNGDEFKEIGWSSCYQKGKEILLKMDFEKKLLVFQLCNTVKMISIPFLDNEPYVFSFSIIDDNNSLELEFI
eukprot:TRINITY_DN2353_c0_g1_i1.p1 TRINITY_DN2353_c0_g1~~TRINITY_DN2353_c0_g1_i1.p1  ORF type:complete len:466 (-),score=109.39 TRINITY_DN2353_c0_g1_i1:2-1399(-)